MAAPLVCRWHVNNRLVNMYLLPVHLGLWISHTHTDSSVPSETSVSWGVVALDTENPPLSRMDASSSDSSESVMAIAKAVVFTSTWGQNGRPIRILNQNTSFSVRIQYVADLQWGQSRTAPPRSRSPSRPSAHLLLPAPFSPLRTQTHTWNKWIHTARMWNPAG